MTRAATPIAKLNTGMLRCGCILGLMAAAWAGEAPLWIEGESATPRDVTANPGLEAVVPDELSGGAWVASFANKGQPTAFIACEVAAPAAGQRRLWLRGTGDLACRLGDGAWLRPTGKPVDHMAISIDGNPGWPTIDWFDFGAVELPAGKTLLTVRLGGEQGDQRFGAVDCLVFASADFTPHGRWKPGEAPAPRPAFAAGQAWDFAPPRDAFDAASLLDLRGLNEAVAGESGFVRMSPAGDLLRGDGQPLRLWAVGVRTSYIDPKLEEAQRTARFLAKRGVNAVRIFAMLPTDKAGSAAGDVNEAELDRVFRLVAAMRSNGIYTIIDPYWGSHTARQQSWDVAHPGGGGMSGLVFFDPKTQAAYRSWMKALLDRPNPYTGIRLADDPAMAILQLQNEDHLLWWTFHGIQGEALQLLRARYAEHITAKYGSLEQAQAAWKGYEAGFPADDKAAAMPGFVHLWDMGNDAWVKKSGTPGFIERTADQLEFICTLTRRFNQETIAWLRKDLGVKSLINANNWQVADMTTTMDAQNWADSDADVMGLNYYTGGPHFGINNGWQILPDHRYGDDSCILRPQTLPTNLKQVAGKAMILPEVLWTPPNLYQAEAPLMMAGQMSLTGIDAGCWFCNYPDEWSVPPGAKWSWSTPMQLGQFPAAALIQRLGYVKRGEPAAVEHRTRADVFARTTPLISQGAGWDPNRQTGIERPDGTAAAKLDALAYLVGPVQVAFDADKPSAQVADLSRCIDRQAKVVKSITGEIETDFGRGVYRINAPCAQAAAGFLGAAGTQQLAEVAITCRNPYAAVAVVSLDQQPLKTSAKVLVQVGTLARPTGWSTQPARFRFEGKWVEGSRIASVGTLPWQVQNIDAVLRIANPRLASATALDANGMKLDLPVSFSSANGTAELRVPDGTLYVILAAASKP